MCAATVVAVVMAVFAPSAGADPATFQTLTQTNGVLSGTWTPGPTGSDAWAVEISISPDRDGVGFFDFVDIVEVAQNATSFTATGPLVPRTYYAHVVTTPTYATCLADVNDPLCILEFSNILSVAIPSPPPPHPPPPPPPPPPPADTVVALGTVTAASSQDVDKLGITLNPGEAVTATLSGSVKVPGTSKAFRFTTVKKSVGAGAKTKLALKLKGKGKKAVKKALKRKKTLKAKLTLVVTDAAGNSKTSKHSVRLRP